MYTNFRNRWFYLLITVTQLKIMQECITLVVFTIMAYFLFGESLRWNIGISYLLIIGAVYFAFRY